MSPQPPDPRGNEPRDQQPQRKPGGLFLILFVVALVLLAVYGSNPATKPMSLDELWVKLYTGQVEKISVNDSGSAFKVSTEDQPGQMRKVPVPDARPLLDQVRRIHAAARRMDDALGIEEFLGAVDSGSLRPLRGYPLRILRPENPDEPDGPVVEEQRFFVEYADAEGKHYAEVDAPVGDDSAIDLGRLVAAFEERGVPLEEGLTFDVQSGVQTEESSAWTTLFLSFGPVLLLIVLFWFLFMRQMRGQGQGLLSFGRSRAVIYNKENRTGVSFDDVAGIEEAKEEVQEITEFLKNPEKFTRLGGRIPRGVLLVGPPGTGKTLLAKAIAGEANVPFVSISGSDFVEMFVGVGASRVRDLFENARKEAPCIVFLDEIDAVGRKRGTGLGGGNDEREQTLNAILVEMDGFTTDDRIIVIAATNRPDVLDGALLRPGRFDREIVIDLPDVAGREKILAVHTRGVKLDPSVDLGVIARGTPGFSGAELAAIVNEAAIIAAMNDHSWVSQADLEEARDKVRFGRQKKTHVMDAEDKRITAYHEAGHAVVNAFMEHVDPVHKVTIIPRGPSLGATMFLPEKDRMHWTKGRLLDNICVSYGGRVAEEMFCDDITTGASSDIQQATNLARRMITDWGMSERLGLVNLGERSGSEYLGAEYGVGKEHSQTTQREIDEEVKEILQREHGRAREILEERREVVERVAQALLRYETITREEFQAVVDGADIESLRADEAQRVHGERTKPPPVPAAAAEGAAEGEGAGSDEDGGR